MPIKSLPKVFRDSVACYLLLEFESLIDMDVLMFYIFNLINSWY